MRLTNVSAATAAILAVAAGTASAAAPITGVAAVKKAQACLMSHGAKAVGAGVTGNGDVSFGAGQNAQWQYRLAKAWPLQNGAVLGVASISYDKRMVAAKRLVVKRCVYAVVPAA
jgi:hypothetical protein